MVLADPKETVVDMKNADGTGKAVVILAGVNNVNAGEVDSRPPRPSSLDLRVTTPKPSVSLENNRFEDICTEAPGWFVRWKRNRRKRKESKRLEKEFAISRYGEGSQNNASRSFEVKHDSSGCNVDPERGTGDVNNDDDDDDDDEDEDVEDNEEDKNLTDGLALNVLIGFAIMLVVLVVGTSMLYAVQKILISSSQRNEANGKRLPTDYLHSMGNNVNSLEAIVHPKDLSAFLYDYGLTKNSNEEGQGQETREKS